MVEVPSSNLGSPTKFRLILLRKINRLKAESNDSAFLCLSQNLACGTDCAQTVPSGTLSRLKVAFTFSR